MFLSIGLVLSDSNISVKQYSDHNQSNLNYKNQFLIKDSPSSTRFNKYNRFSLEQLKLNKQKLNSFKKFNHGWDGYDALVISDELIDKISDIISDLDYQPQIFPTGRGSIQIERYIDDKRFIEIEISEDEVFAYRVMYDNEEEKVISASEINNLINELYA
jgi:hypothetical protein